MASFNSKYYIVTNVLEINIIETINEIKKLAKQFISLNSLYVYDSIIDNIQKSTDISNLNSSLLNTYNDSTSTYYLNNFEESNTIYKNSIYCDKEYDNTKLFNFISDIVNKFSENNYNNYSKTQLSKLHTKIEENIETVLNNNGNIDNNIEKLLEKLQNYFNESPTLAAKYNEEYNELKTEEGIIKGNFSDIKNNLSIQAQILNIIECKVVNLDTQPEVPASSKYKIIVGNKKTIEEKIDDMINTINKLYALLVDTDVYEAEIIYTQILINFITAFNNNPSRTKADLLEEIKSNDLSYQQASEKVQILVDAYINNVKNNNDQSYIYSQSDQKLLNNRLNSVKETYTKQKEKNASIISNINNKKLILNDLIQEYKQEHHDYDSGIGTFDINEYVNSSINEHQEKIPSTESYINYVNNIYSKTKPNVNVTISINHSTLSIPYSKTKTLIATVTPSTVSNKSITWTSSNTNIATVTQTSQSGSAVTVTWVNVGSVIITATSNEDTTKSITCRVTCEDVIKQDPILTIHNPESTIIVDNESATINVTSNVAGHMTFIIDDNYNDGIGTFDTPWRASISNINETTFDIKIFNNVSHSEEEIINKDTIKVRFTPENTTQYNIIETYVNQVDITLEAKGIDYYFAMLHKDNNVITRVSTGEGMNDFYYNIDVSSLTPVQNITDILGVYGYDEENDVSNFALESFNYILLPEEWYTQIRFIIKTGSFTPQPYRVKIDDVNYIILDGESNDENDAYGTGIIYIKLLQTTQGNGGVKDNGEPIETIDKINNQEDDENNYYIYSDDINNGIPDETTIKNGTLIDISSIQNGITIQNGNIVTLDESSTFRQIPNSIRISKESNDDNDIEWYFTLPKMYNYSFTDDLDNIQYDDTFITLINDNLLNKYKLYKTTTRNSVLSLLAKITNN